MKKRATESSIVRDDEHVALTFVTVQPGDTVARTGKLSEQFVIMQKALSQRWVSLVPAERVSSALERYIFEAEFNQQQFVLIQEGSQK